MTCSPTWPLTLVPNPILAPPSVHLPQDKVQKAQRLRMRQSIVGGRPEDLQSIVVEESVGSGGYGDVYRGRCKASDASITLPLYVWT